MAITQIGLWAGAGLAILAAPALAQEEYLGIRDGGVENCPAQSGVGVFRFRNVTPGERALLLFRADVCADLEAGWFVGPETIQNLTQVTNFQDTSFQYQVIEDGVEQYQRASVTFSYYGDSSAPLTRQIGSFHALPNATPDGPMPGAHSPQGRGFLFEPGLAPLATLEPGLWFLSINTYPIPHYWSDLPVDMQNTALGGLEVIARVDANGITFLSDLMTWQETRLTLEVTDGAISGSFGYRQDHRAIPEARGPEEYDWLEVSMTDFIGRGVQTDMGPAVALVAIGEVTGHRDDTGQTHTHPAALEIMGQRAPDDIDPAMLQIFGVDPADL